VLLGGVNDRKGGGLEGEERGREGGLVGWKGEWGRNGGLIGGRGRGWAWCGGEGGGRGRGWSEG